MAYDAVVHLIDDDEAVRQALAFMLTASGFAVRIYELWRRRFWRSLQRCSRDAS